MGTDADAAAEESCMGTEADAAAEESRFASKIVTLLFSLVLWSCSFERCCTVVCVAVSFALDFGSLTLLLYAFAPFPYGATR